MAKPRTTRSSKPEAEISDETASADLPVDEQIVETSEPPQEEESEPVVIEEPARDAGAEVTGPETVSVDAAETPVPPPQTEVKTVKRGGFMPLVAGGVLAAALGAGAVIYALPHLPPQLAGLLPQPSEAAPDKALVARIDALTQELAAVKAATPPAPDMSGVQASLDEIGAQAGAAQAAVQALAARVDTLGQGGATADVSALRSEIDQLRAQLGQGGDVQAQIETASQAAADRIRQAEAEAQQLRQAAEDAAQKAEARGALAQVKAAFDAGLPMAAPLGAMVQAGVEVPAELQGDVPSLQALREAFPDVARTALAEARRAEAGGGMSDRIVLFLKTQTGARAVEPQEGDGADPVLSRAQAAVDAGDLDAALAELARLPEAAQPVLSDWIAQASARIAARDAIAVLEQQLN